jgi:C1A family cysteine protease
MASEVDYPYTSTAGFSGDCLATQTKMTGDSLKSYKMVSSCTLAIKEALTLQPCAVAVESDSSTFKTYSSGVIRSADCGTNVDHTLLAVGYGEDYYILKNSWGVSWGEAGYIRVGMADGRGICGINQYVSYPYF